MILAAQALDFTIVRSWAAFFNIDIYGGRIYNKDKKIYGYRTYEVHYGRYGFKTGWYRWWNFS